MSNVIDERVLEMRFDNRQFEAGVSDTLSSLDELKRSLNMSGASRGLEQVNSAVKSCNMTGLNDAVDQVRVRFSALQVMGVTALTRITNAAMSAGERIVKALTIDPIKTGFQEYETQLNAVQTILANTKSKGKTLTDVNKALDELNLYADKTIYNFTEMTRNIGTFTAAGVDLDTSVSAIKGIANLAAVSGSSSQQASVAMYQLSQALSSGTVRLMDWNSVVNAGMGGQVFQDALKETARVHGIKIDEIIKKQGSFRESLSEGWLSSEILTETLSKFTGDLTKEQLKSMGYTDKQIEGIIELGKTANDAATKVKTFTQLFDTLKEAAQSGWAQSWEIIVGDFEEAKAFMTELSDKFGGIIGASAEARNKILQGWKDLGGRNDLIESIRNIFTGIGSIVTPIKEAFREIIPPVTAKNLAAFTAGLKDLTAKLKLSDTNSANLKRTFKGLFAVVDIVRQVIMAVGRAAGYLIGQSGGLVDGILAVTATIGDWLVNLNNVIKKSDIFNKAFTSLAAVVKFVATVFKELVSFIGEKFVCPGIEILSTLLGKVSGKFSGVSDAAGKMRDDVTSAASSMGAAIENSGLYKFLQGVWNLIKSIGMGIGNILGSAFEGIIESVANANFEDILNVINAIVTGGIGVSIMKFINGLTAPIEAVGDVLGGITGILGGVKDTLAAYQSQLKANALIKIAAAIGILAASILVISFIDSDKLGGSLAAITTMFAELAAIMFVFNKIGGGFKASNNMFKPLITISTAVLILAFALKTVGDLDMDHILSGLVGITGCVALIIATQLILGKLKSDAIKVATQLVIFALAVKVLASTLEDLAYLSWNGIAKGLTGIAGCVTLLVGASILLGKFNSSGMKGALQMVLFAAAIKIMGSTLNDVAYLDWDELARGLTGLAACVALLVGASILLGKFNSGGMKGALQMVIFAGALKIMVSSLKEIGDMQVNNILKGLLGLAGMLTAVTIALNLMPKNMVSKGLGLIAVAAALKIYASAAAELGNISWDGIAKGLVSLAASLAAITIALRLMPKNMVWTGLGLIAVSTALVIMASALGTMGGASWESIAKGLISLGGALAIIAIGLKAMNGTLAGSAALVVAVVSLKMLVPVLTTLGSMGWKAIALGLVALAGAFAIIGGAAYLIGPLAPAVLAIAGAIALLGIAVFAAGSGIAAFGAGLVSLAAGFTAVASSISVMCVGIVSTISAFIVGICDGLAKGIVAFCKIIINGMPAIADVLKAIVLAVCSVLKDSAMPIIETVLELLVKLMQALVEHVPVIVDLLFQFIVKIIDSLAKHVPVIIQKAVELVMTIFKGIISALGSIDKGALMEGMIGVGLMAGVIAALAAIVPMIPGAMVGAIGMGAVVAELAIVFAALGALGNIPGLKWLISEGGDFLEAVGTAIGQFVGGLAGGIAKGFTSALPDIANDLSEFMKNLEPFIDGASRMDDSILSGVKSLVGIIIALTGANIVDGLTSWFTGGSALTKFGDELAEFGPKMKAYSDAIVGVDPASVRASADAAKILVDLANTLPKSGGLTGLLSGNSDMSDFGDGLENLGKGLKSFSTETEGILPENVIAAANAAKALAEMTNVIPNTGGIAAWISGDNSISNFSHDLKSLGKGLKNFSKETEGINPEAIIAAANAAKALAEMTNVIPNTGGIGAWFSGDNSVSKFAGELPKLGKGLKGFSDNSAGIVPENIVAAANSAKALAEMANVIPNTGGIVAWFAGDNSISKFAGQLPALGTGMKAFSDSVAGISPENVTAAANAAKALAEMANVIPNEGGIAAWFSGDASISSFAGQLPILGLGLKGFSDAAAGIVAENIIAAANAAKSLADLTSVIPNEGGIAAWFSGESGVVTFAGQLPVLGIGLKGFSNSVAGINPENVMAAANAAKSLADLVAVIPNEGGIAAWFSGESGVVTFAGQLPTLGAGLKGFSDSVVGISAENVTAAANAAKALAEMTAVIPKEGGIKAWFSGETSIANFADKLPTLGAGIKGFSDSVAGINPENVTAAASAAKSLGEMTDTIPKNTDKIIKFGENLNKFGSKLSSYFTTMSGVSEGSISSANKALDSVKEISEINSGNIKSVASALNDLTKAVKNMAKNIKSDLKDAGKKAIEGFVKGINDNIKSAESAAQSLMTKSADAASKKASAFESAGKSVVEGFAKGISSNTYLAEAKAKAMAQAAYEAAKGALKINSPAKVFIPLGEGTVEGYVKGVDNMSGEIDGSMSGMANTAISGFSNAISNIAKYIDSDIDVQPTITPVLDLSEVESGAGYISSMIGGAQFGLTPSLGAISSMMARRNQNGANDDVVAEIARLRKELGEKEFSNYSIGGISYREGDEVSEAIQILLRAMRLEGRA